MNPQDEYMRKHFEDNFTVVHSHVVNGNRVYGQEGYDETCEHCRDEKNCQK